MSALITAALYPVQWYSTTSSMSSMVRGAHARRRSQLTRSRCCSLPLTCSALHWASVAVGWNQQPSHSMPWPIFMGPTPSSATDPTSLSLGMKP